MSETITPASRVDFVDRLQSGDETTLSWIRQRVERRAAPRFSPSAWKELRDDFTSDLTTQLSSTFGKEGFDLRGPAEAYIDVSIANLCRRYFRYLAQARQEICVDLLPEDSVIRSAPQADIGGSRTLDRIAQSMEVEELLRSVGSKCRRLLGSKYLDGLSTEEIAIQVGATSSQIRDRLHACRSKVRATWKRRTPVSPVKHKFSDGAPCPPTGKVVNTVRRDEGDAR